MGVIKKGSASSTPHSLNLFHTLAHRIINTARSLAHIANFLCQKINVSPATSGCLAIMQYAWIAVHINYCLQGISELKSL